MSTPSSISRARSAPRAGRHGTRRLSTETKAAFKTTEFVAYVVVLLAILIAGDNVGGGEGLDHFRANAVWLYATILTVGYMISRGLAKAGSHEPYDDMPTDEGGLGLSDRLAKAATVLKEGDLPQANSRVEDGDGVSSRGDYP
jgi:hypothetical protein